MQRLCSVKVPNFRENSLSSSGLTFSPAVDDVPPANKVVEESKQMQHYLSFCGFSNYSKLIIIFFI